MKQKQNQTRKGSFTCKIQAANYTINLTKETTHHKNIHEKKSVRPKFEIL